MKNSRRAFVKQASLAGGAVLVSKMGWTASSYRRIIGANDRVRVGVVGFSDRHQFNSYALLHESLQGTEF